MGLIGWLVPTPGTRMSGEPNTPAGREFLNALLEQEGRFEATFWAWISSETSENGPDLLEALGIVLSFLDRIAACRWGCDDSEHNHPERHLATRAYSNARAAVRLLSGGYFAEAVTIFRSLGEAANLMYLLLESEEEREKFRNASESARQKHFGAGEVRRKLEGLGKGIYLNQRPYKALSRSVVHPSTASVSLSHHVSGTSTMGGDDERVATLKCFYALATQICGVLLCGMELLDEPADKMAALQAVTELQDAIEPRMAVLIPE